MTLELQKMSVQEIRLRLLSDHRPISARMLAQLQKDPRRGVRGLYRTLEKRRRERRGEEIRVRSLLHFEEVLWRSGIEHVAGVDEVGIGPLAGPVVAAAVIFAPHTFIEGIDDSKKLDPGQRERLGPIIQERARAYSIAIIEVEEVDRLNVYHAGLEAMRRAVCGLTPPPLHVLVDAREIPRLAIPQNRFDKGDGINFSIAAASILAKTCRDALMDRLHEQFPQYGFNSHKGYSTPQHQAALREYGPCPIHRRSFPFVQEICGKLSQTYYRLKGELEAAPSHARLREFEERLGLLQGELTDYEMRKLRMCCKRRWTRLSALAD